jgi:alkyl hydroperoxide reductase subunit AhpC
MTVEEPPRRARLAKVGRLAPNFSGKALFPDSDIRDIDLEGYRGKWIVLFSWALDFSFVCPTEIIQFNDVYDQFRSYNCELIGLSTDSAYCHLAWTELDRKEGGIGQVRFPLIGDIGGRISKDFGFYHEPSGHDLRGTVIIDPDGLIVHFSLNQTEVGRSVTEVLRLVKGCQFANAHPQ